jgi:hypothetical protein
MNVEKKSDILVALNREAESRHETDTVFTDVRYHCSASSEDITHSSTSTPTRRWECSTGASKLSASIAHHSDEAAFAHTPLYR